jgi:hypothetical protein|tara:strand:+ start:2031 stop:2504 length:474 start_codon:yes stop_codon:yes gene_type:complete
MSNKRGIRSYYLIMEKLEQQLLESPFVKTVTFGDISQVDLRKQTIFPLSHIIMNNVVQSGQVMTYNMTILLMDIVDINKAIVVNQFTGNTDEMDILNTQLGVGNRLVEQMRSGQLFNDMYQVDTDVTFEPFFDRFENELVGWAMNVNITVENDIYIC